MLCSLAIKNFILIENLSLSFGRGLGVLTGETGAGKSILLDAVAFALGGKVDPGPGDSTVCAVFRVPESHPCAEFLRDKGIAVQDGEISIRRFASKDGKTKAFINDVPSSLALAKAAGDFLVEIHGQFDNQSLLNPARHLSILDSFARVRAEKSAVKAAWDKWQAASGELEAMRRKFDNAKRDEDYLRYNCEELAALAPEAGEEALLDARRKSLMAGEKAATAVADAIAKLTRDGAPLDAVADDAAGELARAAEMPEIALAVESLESAGRLLRDAYERLLQISARGDSGDLENVEERLFKIRDLARKHRVAADDLPSLAASMKAALDGIDNGDALLLEKSAEAEKAKAEYDAAAGALTLRRKAAAGELASLVMAELSPLKLDKAVFFVELSPAEPSQNGSDAAVFSGSMNYGERPVPLHKSASGGELARLTLAIKVVLLDTFAPCTMIFDEVDSGISGATAAAVGERLARLGSKIQTLVVTHSPQVAAFGREHFKVSKGFDPEKQKTITEVEQLDERCREIEIARIISGDKITDEAMAAARQLIKLGRKQ